MVERVERRSARTTSASPAAGVSGYQLTSAVIVFAAALTLYAFTLAPTVTLVDSGELIVAAHSAGVAHPPGFPLYVMLAHLATLVPVGNIAQRANFASALFGAAAAGAVALAAFEALDTRRGVPRTATAKSKRRKKKAEPAPPSAESTTWSDSSWSLVLPSLTAGLLFSASRTLWSYATVAEVYTLNSLLIALCLFFLFRWRRLALDAQAEPPQRIGAKSSPNDRWLYAAALSFGLGLGVHHVTVGLLLPALVFLVLRTNGASFFLDKRFLIAALCVVAGLSVYVYLPAAASAAPIMNWGDPRTFDRFVSHVTGRQYQEFFESRPDRIGQELRDFLGYLLREFGKPWLALALVLALVGLGYLLRRARVLFWFLVIATGVNLAYNSSYEIAQDKDAYYLPVFLILSITVAFGVRSTVESILAFAASRVAFDRTRTAMISFVLILAVIPSISFASNFPFNNRREYFIARDYVQNILTTVESGGMLLTLDWQVYSPSLYMREIDQFRRDAVVIDINQLRRSWYFAYLEQAYPDTMAAARAQVDDFLDDLRGWEADSALYARDTRLNQRISERFRTLILTLISNHVKSGPVYVTLDIASYGEGRDSDWAKQIARMYQMVPQGLVFQLFTEPGFHEPANPPLVTRGLSDGSIRYADNDVVKLNIIPIYASMFFNRGRYLAAAGRHTEASEAFSQSLAMSPGFSPAARALAESQGAMRR